MPFLRAIVSGITLLALVTMAGCATPRPWLAPLAPDTLGASVQARQEITALRKGQTRSLQVALKADANTLTIIGLSALGQRLFTLVWDGQDAEVTSQIDNLQGFDPYWILADMQMAYWPLVPLRAALPADLQLTEHGSTRTLWRGDELLWFRSSAGADIWHSNLLLYNARLGYRLRIKPLSISDTAQ